jgi:hypothetical protein
MKADQCFRRNLYLLSASHSIYTGAHATAGNRPNCRTFTASQKAPKDGANGSAASGLNRRILSSAVPVLGECVGHEIHWMIHRIDPCQLDR